MRAYTDHWKSGRYQIALVAGVPCGLGYIDDGQKTLGIEIFLTFTGDAAADMEQLAAFYADKRGCRPEQASEIRLLNSGASRPGGRGRAPFESPGG